MTPGLADLQIELFPFMTDAGAGVLDLEQDSTRREFPHPVAVSDAAKVGAGLFTRPLA